MPLRCLFILAGSLGVLLAARPARADTSALPRATELVDPRALTMGGAGRAIGASNDALVLNPAALAATQQYAFGGFWEHDVHSQLDVFGVAASDSTAGAVAGGLAFHRYIAGPSGARTTANVFHLGLAFPLTDAILVGASAKYLHIASAGTSHNVFTPDVGLILKLEPLTLGGVIYNVVDVHDAQAPARQYALAASFGQEHGLRVATDVVFDRSYGDTRLAYHAGVEYEPLPVLSIRAGYVEDRIRSQRFASGGVGLALPPGFNLDLGYQHQLGGDAPLRQFAVALRIPL